MQMKKSEKLLELEKSIKTTVSGVSSLEDLESLPEYVEMFVSKELLAVLENLRPRIEEFHDVESRNPLSLGDKILISGQQNSRKGIEPYYRKDFTATHYTSINAIVSILQNVKAGKEDSLRMYDSVHLNDPDEGNYIARELKRRHRWLEKKDVSHAYIVSFVAPEKQMVDNLTLWRTYGKEGEGCSLSLHVPPERLKKVRYGEEMIETVRILEPVLDSLDPLVDAEKVPLCSIRRDIQTKLSEIIWKFLERFLYLYKSKAHEHEKEYRIVLIESEIEDKERIHFEIEEGENTPVQVRHYYADEDLKAQNLLDENSLITLGPSITNPYNMSYYLKTLIREADLSGPEIETSRELYRKS